MKKGNVFWGLFFVLGAVFILLSKIGYFADVNVFSLILTVILAGLIVKSVVDMEFGGIFFSAAFIAIIYSEAWGIEDLTPWPVLGAALLATIGCGMIFGNRYRWQKKYRVHEGNFAEEVIDHPDGEKITFETHFGGSIKYVNTDDFKQADLRCSFGSMKVYFDNAIIQGDNAYINLDCSFAGVELFIPRTWQMINKSNFTFGDVAEKNRTNRNETTKTITLVGNANFCGVDIIYI